MRGIDQVDFETGNVEFIEFWLQDPHLMKTPAAQAVNCISTSGNISEDVLKDGKRFFEKRYQRCSDQGTGRFCYQMG